MTVDLKGIGKITASKDALNAIAGIIMDASRYNEEDYQVTAVRLNENFYEIFDVLDATGYYDKFKGGD